MSSLFEAKLLSECQNDLFRFELGRYPTFQDFPFSSSNFPLLLAKHGFVSMGNGTNFMCRCCFCGYVVPYHKWIEHPDIQHAHYSSCSLRRGGDNGNVPVTKVHVSFTTLYGKM